MWEQTRQHSTILCLSAILHGMLIEDLNGIKYVTAMKNIGNKIQLLTFNLTGPSNATCFASLTVSQIKLFPLTN